MAIEIVPQHAATPEEAFTNALLSDASGCSIEAMDEVNKIIYQCEGIAACVRQASLNANELPTDEAIAGAMWLIEDKLSILKVLARGIHANAKRAKA